MIAVSYLMKIKITKIYFKVLFNTTILYYEVLFNEVAIDQIFDKLTWRLFNFESSKYFRFRVISIFDSKVELRCNS